MIVNRFVDLLRGLGVTFGTMFRAPVTIPYPEVKRPVAERFKGRHDIGRNVFPEIARGVVGVEIDERCPGCL